MSSSSGDEEEFENFMSRLKNDRKAATTTADGFIFNEAVEVKTSNAAALEYRLPKFLPDSSTSSSDGDKFEDAVEDIEKEPPKKENTSPPIPQRRCLDDDTSEEDDDNFENFVSALKNDKVIPTRINGSSLKKAKSMDSFIVDDDMVDELEETWTSGSANEEEEEETTSKSDSRESSPDDATTARRLFHQLQLEDERRLERKIICKTSPKRAPPKRLEIIDKKLSTELKAPKKVENERTKQHYVEKLKPSKPVDADAEFLYALSENDGAYVGNGDEVKKLRRAFVKKRLEMAKRVAEISNRRCFDGKMPMDIVTIEFTKRLLKTAGDTTTKGALGARTCRIRLADKVCDTPGRLRDTLIHELCHAAVTMIDGVLHHRHGPLWVKWTRVVTKCFPNLPPITVCHRYTIQTKYVYVCLTCSHQYGRHSKSIDVNTQRCGHCRGHLELQKPSGGSTDTGVGDDGKTKILATPQTERPKNAWTTFVSANFASVKREMPPKSAHKDVMARLKVMYQSKRDNKDNNNDEPEVPQPPITPVINQPRRPNTAEIDEQIDLILASSFNFNLNLN